MTEWRPWDEFKKQLEILPIEETPCKYCAYFKPQRKYTTTGIYDGVVICHAEEMHSDFSCFEKKYNG